jgi:cell division protein FtsL
MQANRKVKLIIVLAITLIAFLLISSISLLVSIFATQNKINEQNAEIEKLNNQIKYYEQIQNQEEPDFNIETDGE